MARSNVIEFARGFQESFQRSKALDLQRQREERFDRQLTANAEFQQSQLNLSRRRVELAEAEFERGRPKRLQAIQTGDVTSVFDPATGGIRGTAFPSAKVAGEGRGTLPGKFGLASELSAVGLTGTAVSEAIQNIPSDLNKEAAAGFLRASDETILPFFQQEPPITFGLGKGFRSRIFRPNVSQEEITPVFKKFLQDTNFAGSSPDQQEGILRAFEESLGQDVIDGPRAVPRDEVDFDLESPFFKQIIEAERAKATQPELPERTPTPGTVNTISSEPNTLENLRDEVSGLSSEELQRILAE